MTGKQSHEMVDRLQCENKRSARALSRLRVCTRRHSAKPSPETNAKETDR